MRPRDNDDVAGMPSAPIGALAGSQLPLSPIWVTDGVVFWPEHNHRQVAVVLTDAGMQIVAAVVKEQAPDRDGRLNVYLAGVHVGHILPTADDGWLPVFYARSGEMLLDVQSLVSAARLQVRLAAG